MEKDFEKICDNLLNALVSHSGAAIVGVVGYYRGGRALDLRHELVGQGLDLAHAEKALEHVYRLWGRPIHLETRQRDRDQPLVLSYDPEGGHKRG